MLKTSIVRSAQLLASTWVLHLMTETPSLPRTFVSFSSADKRRYDLMCAWKAHQHIDFNFADFQLDEAINSQRPNYIKSVCAAKIRRADTFVLLIGTNARHSSGDAHNVSSNMSSTVFRAAYGFAI